MAAPQQYSLRWNNYLRHLTYALDNHRNNDDFVDVSLLCDGRKIKAHKVVLSACSSYFKEIFIENPHPHPVIIFKFIKFEDLNSIIEFMYQGEVNVQQEALQSFLQTAELLAVQGLTSEEKEKPKPPSPIIDDHKLVKTIPSTIRAVNDNTAATQTTLEISTNNILQATTQQLQVTQQLPQPQQHHVQTQIHPIQMQQQQQQQQQQPPTQCNPTISQHAHQQQVNVTAPHHTLQQIQQVTQHSATQSPTQSIQVNTQNQIGTTGIVTMPVSHGNTMKKRKLTFADDDDNIYTAESVDYGIKDEQNIVKTADVTLLRGTIKMDIPEYIISDDRLTDEDVSQGHNADTSQNVTTQQYTSTEYEILTESEIEEKYHQQVESDNNEITIEMGRLLNTATASTATAAQHALDDSPNLNNTNAGNTTTLKNENKTNSTTGAGTDLPNNKWTECQFCKMVITTVNLWRHIRTQHTPQPPRKCDFCNKNFKNKYSLREHIRISHEQKLALKSEN